MMDFALDLAARDKDSSNEEQRFELFFSVS